MTTDLQQLANGNIAATGVVEFAAAAAADDDGAATKTEVSVTAFDYAQLTSNGIGIAAGAFKKSLKALADIGAAIPMLLNHDPDKMLGAFQKWTNGKALKATGEIDHRLKWAGEAIAARECGALRSCSIGFIIEQAEWSDDYSTLTVQQARLLEISLCPAGMQPNARMLSASAVLPHPQRGQDTAAFTADELKELVGKIQLINATLKGAQQ